MAVRSDAQELEESKCHPSLQKGQGGVPRQRLPYLSLCKCNELPRSGGHLQVHGRPDSDQE